MASTVATPGNLQSPQDSSPFSEPWNFSDVVLSVDGEKLHAHRSILSMWSPVFYWMFAADFRENADEIPLPGKKAVEIKELLLVIYPTFSKPISEENCYFLLPLADEYLMQKVKGKCEEYLVNKVKHHGFLRVHPCGDFLVLGQKYHLERLQTECVNQLQGLAIGELKAHDKYLEMSDSNIKLILLGKVEKAEGLEADLAQARQQISNLQEKTKASLQALGQQNAEYQKLKSEYHEMKGMAKNLTDSVILCIGGHAMFKNNMNDHYNPSVEYRLQAILGDKQTIGKCRSLDGLHSILDKLYKLIA